MCVENALYPLLNLGIDYRALFLYRRLPGPAELVVLVLGYMARTVLCGVNRPKIARRRMAQGQNLPGSESTREGSVTRYKERKKYMTDSGNDSESCLFRCVLRDSIGHVVLFPNLFLVDLEGF